MLCALPEAVLMLFHKMALKVNKSLTKTEKIPKKGVCVEGGGGGTQKFEKSTPLSNIFLKLK